MAIKEKDKVKLDYEGKLEDGHVFDSSKHGEHSHPLEFVVGSGMVIKGFDEAVKGMEKDEEKEFSIEPEDAYGQYNPELKRDIPKNVLPPEQEPKEGMMLGMRTPDGQTIPAKIVSVDKDKITIDVNHPLAGKKLFFKIKILDIEEA